MKNLVNQVQLIGHLGHDPELITFGTGSNLVKLRLATNESYKTSDGQKNEITQWHTISAWGRVAEKMAAELSKGQKVMIKGRLEHRRFKDKEGLERMITQIKANFFAPLTGQQSAKAARPLPF